MVESTIINLFVNQFTHAASLAQTLLISIILHAPLVPRVLTEPGSGIFLKSLIYAPYWNYEYHNISPRQGMKYLHAPPKIPALIVHTFVFHTITHDVIILFDRRALAEGSFCCSSIIMFTCLLWFWSFEPSSQPLEIPNLCQIGHAIRNPPWKKQGPRFAPWKIYDKPPCRFKVLHECFQVQYLTITQLKPVIIQ